MDGYPQLRTLSNTSTHRLHIAEELLREEIEQLTISERIGDDFNHLFFLRQSLTQELEAREFHCYQHFG